jgi:repressor LexA
MGFSSPRSASVVIDELVRGGLLSKRRDGRLQVRSTSQPGTITVDVPIVGSAPCGTPLLTEQNIEGSVRVDARLAPPPHRYFILRAHGDSMDRAGILDGDLVLVRHTSKAVEGDRVVALVDGESTIKTLRLEGDVVALQPCSTNRSHYPIYATSEIIIQGVVATRLPRA